ncbi:LIC11755 family lipoprotein [Leptospira meyeri]|uniref:LIC11755 family lipoprotein n=1 Tax=Leptospira meyeri TaxID=29508 RepID=UPI00108255E3|nr:lamin tail domain-containing protein [Leptospira meyeri]TGM20875.1 lamin tail domain-containing protein [Leptospira meyeri]
MQKQIKILLFFLLCSCQNKEETPFFMFGGPFGDSPYLEFQYGNLEEEGNVIEDSNQLGYESGLLCIYSLPISLYRRELGGKFRICWKTDESIFEKWKLGFSILEEEKNEYTSWLEKGKGWSATLKEYGNWKKESDKLGFVLDWDSQIWSNGFVTYQTFGLPHPIFLQRTVDQCEVLFSSHQLKGTLNKQLVLSFELPCPDIGAITEKIQTQNEEWFSECEPGEPVVSEMFRHSESSFQRFLEWENPKETFLCPRSESLGWEKEGSKTFFRSEDFSKRTKLILPKGIVLFSDEPKFHGIFLPKEYGSNIGTKTKVWWGNSEYIDSEFNFRQGNEFFSNEYHSVSCRDQFQFWTGTDRFCGNPGLPNQFEIKPKEGGFPGCSIGQFQITEFYPGNQFDSQFPFPSFFEFQNKGESCDASSLNWIYNDTIYPLSADEWVIQSNSYFIISKKLWFGWDLKAKEKPFSIPKFVFQIPKFVWEDRKSQEKREFQPNSRIFHLLRFNQQNRYSIVRESEVEFPHPREGSSSEFLDYGFQFSPGKPNKHFASYISTDLLEYGPNQSPFLDFGFHGREEGLVLFERENGNQFLFWKPEGKTILTFGTEPSVCNGNFFYQLPDDFFTNTLSSLRFLGIQNTSPTLLSWDPKFAKEKTLGGTRSLHPEPNPILFSNSLVSSTLCSGDWRSPGLAKERSLEIEKLNIQGRYFTNLSLGSQTNVQLGNGNGKIPISYVSLGNQNYQLDNSGLSSFSSEEQLYSYWSDPSLIKSKSFLERKGPVQIEAIFPNPKDSQNEWVYICNRSDASEDLSLYLVEDEVSVDELTSYQSRFPSGNPLGKNGQKFQTNRTILDPNVCAWIVDPDGKDWFLPIFHSESDLLLTVKTTQTIGNGISSGEFIQLRKKQEQQSIMISSFGQKESYSSFHLPVITGEFLWLKSGASGMSPLDYEIFREEF